MASGSEIKEDWCVGADECNGGGPGILASRLYHQFGQNERRVGGFADADEEGAGEPALSQLCLIVSVPLRWGIRKLTPSLVLLCTGRSRRHDYRMVRDWD